VQQSRRNFLIQSAGFAAALEVNQFSHLLEPVTAYRAARQQLPAVCAAQGTNADSMASILKTSLDGLGGIERFVKAGQVVAIKPNATWAYPPHTASSSDPELIEAIVTLVREAGAKRIIVMDHCSIDPGAAESLRVSGIGKMVDKLGVEKIFPDRFNAPKSVYTTIDFPSGKIFKKMGVIKAAVEADVRINLAVAKTHNVTKFTMALKHMMGFLELPGLLHTGLEQGIGDLSTPSAVQAQLHILEAVRVRLPSGPERVCAGPETDLTHPDRVKRMNQIISGVDPVLIDAYGCERLFNARPQELSYVLRAAERGIGSLDVKKAIADGSLLEWVVGKTQPRPTVTPTPRPVEITSTLPATKPVDSVKKPTLTALPTATGAANEGRLNFSPPQIGVNPGAAPSVSLPSSQPEICPAALSTTTQAAGNCAGAINPNSFLSVALLPVAAVVLGAGLVVMRRLRNGAKEQGEVKDDQ